MRKSLLLTACLVATVTTLISAPVDTTTGKLVASNFYRDRTGIQSTRGVNPVLFKTFKTLPREGRDSLSCIYIYNMGGGYVILSADDRITPILGYSTEGEFDTQHTPEQLQEWLAQRAAEICAAVTSPAYTNEAAGEMWRALASENHTPSRYGSVVVAPLVDIHWNQSPYYNNYCPYDASAGERTVTGCVATAMAQLIRFWQYPPQGIGSHSYTHSTYGVQSANFGATTYDYSLMPHQLSGSSSAAEINEVARLNYHCGVSVDMDYGLNVNGGSGASVVRAANSFNTYFGYSGCQYENKASYSNTQWINKLKTELNNGRPVLYSGSGSGGHAFICDGYTIDNYFHFNFGWGGYQDGYFLLDSITPGSNNFSYTQGGIFNLSASLPILRASKSEINFLLESGNSSEGVKVNIITHNVSSPITVATIPPFAISADSINYGNSITIGTGGGHFFVRYEPNAGLQADTGIVTISSGTLATSVTLQGYTYNINCLPISDINITSSDLEHILLTWSEPTIDTTPQTLSWNDGHISNYSFNDNKVTLLQRFVTSDLASIHGKTLTGISFYVTTDFSALKLVVYKGGNYNSTSFNPGTLILEDSIPVSSLTENSWNTFTLSTPITIDAHQELCFGVYMESSATYPIPIGSSHTENKGFIVGYTNSGGGQGWYQPNNYSVSLRGIVQSTQRVAQYEVSRDGVQLGTTVVPSYNDVLSHTDTYLYTITAIWDNGCSSSRQMEFTNTTSILTDHQRLEFHNNYGYSNTFKSILVSGIGLSQPIQANAIGNFQVSTNGTTFSTSVTLPVSGGQLYVKYTPVSNSTPFETGQIVLSSETISAFVSLYGQCHDNCNPPEGLVLSASGPSVNLHWNAPTFTPEAPATLSWCTSFSYSYFWTGTDGNLTMF